MIFIHHNLNDQKLHKKFLIKTSKAYSKLKNDDFFLTLGNSAEGDKIDGEQSCNFISSCIS